MKKNNENHDVLKAQGRMALGYGIIPKAPMQDKRLTLEAKAIYSYFCSYAGAGSIAFPSRKKILYDLQIGETRYYKHFNLLKKYGYISVEQGTSSTGKFRNNIYTLNEVIESCPQDEGTKPCPRTQNEDTSPYPCTQNEGAESPCTQNAGTGGGGTNSNIDKTNKLVIMSKSKSESKSDKAPELSTKGDNNRTMTQAVANDSVQKNSSAELSTKGDNNRTMTQAVANDSVQKNSSEKKERPFKTDTSKNTGISSKSPTDADEYNTYLRIIQDNINYTQYAHDYPRQMRFVDELINCMLDVICTKGDTVWINGEEKNRDMVKSQYLKINAMDIEHVIDQYRNQYHKISYPHKYLKTMLYTVKQESYHYYVNSAKVNNLIP